VGSTQSTSQKLFWIALSASRSLIGVMWLMSLRWKLPPDFVPPAGMRGLMDWLQLEVAHPTVGLYADLVSSVVIPNFTAFAWIVFLSELLVGLLLLTGTFTRVGALIGLLMSLNLGIGLADVPGEWPWSYLMMAMWHGVFLVSPTLKLWGVDRWLGEKFAPGRIRSLLFG
jgi:uncharacterized membrane protein YphA (DoxX/SURF4 family)